MDERDEFDSSSFDNEADKKSVASYFLKPPLPSVAEKDESIFGSSLEETPEEKEEIVEQKINEENSWDWMDKEIEESQVVSSKNFLTVKGPKKKKKKKINTKKKGSTSNSNSKFLGSKPRRKKKSRYPKNPKARRKLPLSINKNDEIESEPYKDNKIIQESQIMFSGYDSKGSLRRRNASVGKLGGFVDQEVIRKRGKKRNTIFMNPEENEDKETEDESEDEEDSMKKIKDIPLRKKKTLFVIFHLVFSLYANEFRMLFIKKQFDDLIDFLIVTSLLFFIFDIMDILNRKNSSKKKGIAKYLISGDIILDIIAILSIILETRFVSEMVMTPYFT